MPKADLRPRRAATPSAAALAAIVIWFAASLAGPGTALATGSGRASSGVPVPVFKAAPISTAMSIVVPASSPIGQDVAVSATLKDVSGTPIAGQYVVIVLAGTQVFGGSSDGNGQISTVILGKRLKQAGALKIDAVFSGSHDYLPSSASANMTVQVAGIEIQTVPPVQGLRFFLAGASALTGLDGSADLPVPAAGTYRLTSDLNPSQTAETPVRASIFRWDDGVETADRVIVVNGPAIHILGLRTATQGQVSFVDQAGRPVDPKLISEAAFAASDGATVTLNGQTGVAGMWWTSNTANITGPNNTIAFAPVSYTAKSVKIHGADALAPGQQSWTPSSGTAWTVRLQLYTLTVRTQDAVMGAPISGKVDLEMPDSTTVTEPIAADGTTTFTGLPAGSYTLSADPGGPGRVRQAVSVPTSAVQTLRLVTYADAAVIITPGIGIAVLALLALVRLRAIRRRRIVTADAP